jgi:Domain of unknown function (DUF4389)
MTDIAHDNPSPTSPTERKLWVRALIMLLLVFTFQIGAWALALLAVIQLIFSAATGEALPRLKTLGQSLGRYLAEIAEFASFKTEQAPFPFSDWPVVNDVESAGSNN